MDQDLGEYSVMTLIAKLNYLERLYDQKETEKEAMKLLFKLMHCTEIKFGLVHELALEVKHSYTGKLFY